MNRLLVLVALLPVVGSSESVTSSWVVNVRRWIYVCKKNNSKDPVMLGRSSNVTMMYQRDLGKRLGNAYYVTNTPLVGGEITERERESSRAR
jgi:hypothetical protein